MTHRLICPNRRNGHWTWIARTPSTQTSENTRFVLFVLFVLGLQFVLGLHFWHWQTHLITCKHNPNQGLLVRSDDGEGRIGIELSVLTLQTERTSFRTFRSFVHWELGLGLTHPQSESIWFQHTQSRSLSTQTDDSEVESGTGLFPSELEGRDTQKDETFRTFRSTSLMS